MAPWPTCQQARLVASPMATIHGITPGSALHRECVNETSQSYAVHNRTTVHSDPGSPYSPRPSSERVILSVVVQRCLFKEVLLFFF